MTKNAVRLNDLQAAINEAIVMCYDNGKTPKEVFVHVVVVMNAGKITMKLKGDTMWIGGDAYLDDADFELEE